MIVALMVAHLSIAGSQCVERRGLISDLGHEDSWRGWYDAQGCGSGECWDYCRWVGNDGSLGDPRQTTGSASDSGSRWSCVLANESGADTAWDRWGTTWPTSLYSTRCLSQVELVQDAPKGRFLAAFTEAPTDPPTDALVEAPTASPTDFPPFCYDPQLLALICFVNSPGVNCPTIGSLRYGLNQGIVEWTVGWNFQGGVTEALSCLNQDPTIEWTQCAATCRYNTSVYQDPVVSEFNRSREQFLLDHASFICSNTCVEKYNSWMVGETITNPGSQVPTQLAPGPTVEPTRTPTSTSSLDPAFAPTEGPTSLPTSAPLAAPTDYQTIAPIGPSSVAPTMLPPAPTTDAPTSEPTGAPTGAPTTDPTEEPTPLSTHAPTADPIASPTQASTPSPTDAATGLPTTAPTHEPTPLETDVPTAAPMAAPQDPTLPPTDAPTETPTDAATQAPTPPTDVPTSAPTDSPTDAPTVLPTDAPTQAPTPPPTDVPTSAPTDSPNDAPTVPPTDAPTQAPTSPPTDALTESPTGAPTQAPTPPPTDAPTAPPTSAPTDAPTDAPTLSPTDAPTQAPTLPTYTYTPTDAPTMWPADAPTQAPTPPPTDAPTASPTTTLPPTDAPTQVPTPPTGAALSRTPTGAPTQSPTPLLPRPTASPEVCSNFSLMFPDCMTCPKLVQVNPSTAWPWLDCSARPKVKFNYTKYPKALPTHVRFGYKLGVAAKDAKGFSEETQKEHCSMALGIKGGACTLAMRFEVRQTLKANPPMAQSVMEAELARVYGCGFPDAVGSSDNNSSCSLTTTRRLQTRATTTIQPATVADYSVTIDTRLLELFQIAASPASEGPNITNASSQGDPVSLAIINAVVDVAGAGDSPKFTQLLDLLKAGNLANASIFLASLYSAVGLNITVDSSSFDLDDPFSYYYLPTDYGDCHGCGWGGRQYRQASCIEYDGNETNDSLCSEYPIDLWRKCWGWDCGDALAVVAIGLSVFGSVCGCCCVCCICFIRKWRRRPLNGTLKTDEDLVGVTEITWEIKDNRETNVLPTDIFSRLARRFGRRTSRSDQIPSDHKRHIIWNVTEKTVEKFTIAEEKEQEVEDAEVIDVHQEEMQEVMQETRKYIPIYSDSERVEYFSESHSIWLLGSIEVVVLPDQSVVYYNVLLTTKQIRWNVPLHLMRRPLKPLEPVCVFDPQRDCWKHAFISPATIPDQTLHGYRINYALPRNDDPDIPEMQLAPATTVVRRFPPDSKVDVYKGHTVGWWPAIVLNFIEETPPAMRVDDKAKDKTRVAPKPPSAGIFEWRKRQKHRNGHPISLWCRAIVRYIDEGTAEEVDTWLLRMQESRMEESSECDVALSGIDDEPFAV